MLHKALVVEPEKHVVLAAAPRPSDVVVETRGVVLHDERLKRKVRRGGEVRITEVDSGLQLCVCGAVARGELLVSLVGRMAALGRRSITTVGVATIDGTPFSVTHRVPVKRFQARAGGVDVCVRVTGSGGGNGVAIKVTACHNASQH